MFCRLRSRNQKQAHVCIFCASAVNDKLNSGAVCRSGPQTHFVFRGNRKDATILNKRYDTAQTPTKMLIAHGSRTYVYYVVQTIAPASTKIHTRPPYICTCRTWSFAGSTPALARAAGRHETAEPCPPFGFTKRVCSQAKDTTSKKAFARVTYSSTRRVCSSRAARQRHGGTSTRPADGRRARAPTFFGVGSGDGGRRKEGGLGIRKGRELRMRINGKKHQNAFKVDAAGGGAAFLLCSCTASGSVFGWFKNEQARGLKGPPCRRMLSVLCR